MKNYIKLIAIGALLLGGTTIVQSDQTSKTNKRAEAKGKPTPKKADPREARKRYAALRKRMEGYTNSRTSGRRADILKKFDKNKDGKLDDKERAEAQKAMSEWRKKSSAKGKPNARKGDKGPRREGDKRRSRSSRKSRR